MKVFFAKFCNPQCARYVYAGALCMREGHTYMYIIIGHTRCKIYSCQLLMPTIFKFKASWLYVIAYIVTSFAGPPTGAICESFLCEILVLDRNAKVFSLKSFPLYGNINSLGAAGIYICPQLLPATAEGIYICPQ